MVQPQLASFISSSDVVVVCCSTCCGNKVFSDMHNWHEPIKNVTRSRKRDQVVQKFEIALLLPAHSTFYCKWNGTKIIGTRVLLWSYGCIRLGNSGMVVSRKMRCNSKGRIFRIL